MMIRQSMNDWSLMSSIIYIATWTPRLFKVLYKHANTVNCVLLGAYQSAAEAFTLKQAGARAVFTDAQHVCHG